MWHGISRGERMDLEPEEDGSTTVLVFKTLSDPFSGQISMLRVASGTLSSDSVNWNAHRENDEKVGHLMEMQGKQGTQIQKLITGDIGGVAKLKITHTGDTLCQKKKPVKLVWNEPLEDAIAFAIEPKSKGDEEKIGEALARLMEEDLKHGDEA